MAYKVKNPISLQEAKNILSDNQDFVKISHEFKESSGDRWTPTEHEFKPGDLAVVSTVCTSVDKEGFPFGTSFDCLGGRERRLVVVVGRTYCDKSGEPGPYLVYVKNGSSGFSGYCLSRAMLKAEMSYIKWLQ